VDLILSTHKNNGNISGGFMKRKSIKLLFYLVLPLLLLSVQTDQVYAKSRKGKLIVNTPAKQRLAWFAQHQVLKKKSPFKLFSGRITDVEVHPQNRGIIFAGAATGGVWKTENSGTTWFPVMDDVASISVGDIAISASQSDTVWVGTGEANIFRGSVAGVGVYKSINGGQDWKHIFIPPIRILCMWRHPEMNGPSIPNVGCTKPWMAE
jgi:hypothetical protein